MVANQLEGHPSLKIKLGFIRNKVRGMSTMAKADRKELENKIRDYASQDPIMTTMALVNACIRADQYTSLEIVKSILEQPIGEENAISNFAPTASVIEFAMFKLLLGFYDVDPMWNFFQSGIIKLVDHGFITFSKMAGVLRKLGKEFSKVELIENVCNIVRLYRALITPHLKRDEVPLDELKNHKKFLVRCKALSQIFDYSGNLMAIREHCIELITIIDQKLGVDEKEIEEIETKIMELNEGTILELGLVYVRYPKLQNSIKERIIQESIDPKWDTLKGYRELKEAVFNLAYVSCHMEWKDVIQFIHDVICPHHPIISQIGCVGFVNRIEMEAFQSRSAPSSKFLGFYRSFLECIKNDESLFGDHDVHLDIIKTFVSLLVGLYHVDAETLQQPKVPHSILNQKYLIATKILHILNDFVDWAHEKNVVYKARFMRNIWKPVNLIPTMFAMTASCMIPYEKILTTLNEMEGPIDYVVRPLV